MKEVKCISSCFPVIDFTATFSPYVFYAVGTQDIKNNLKKYIRDIDETASFDENSGDCCVEATLVMRHYAIDVDSGDASVYLPFAQSQLGIALRVFRAPDEEYDDANLLIVTMEMTSGDMIEFLECFRSIRKATLNNAGVNIAEVHNEVMEQIKLCEDFAKMREVSFFEEMIL